MEDLDEIRTKFKDHAKRLGIDFPNVDSGAPHINPTNQQIEQFISLKQSQHQNKANVITDIGYYNDHQTVDLQQILQWLGTLLDNAFEATIENPIYVRLVVTSSRITLSVANEYLAESSGDLGELFKQGYSTKGEGRGLGLYHLNETVTNLGGTVTCFEEYNDVHESTYLNVCIKFRTSS